MNPVNNTYTIMTLCAVIVIVFLFYHLFKSIIEMITDLIKYLKNLKILK